MNSFTPHTEAERAAYRLGTAMRRASTYLGDQAYADAVKVILASDAVQTDALGTWTIEGMNTIAAYLESICDIRATRPDPSDPSDWEQA